MKKEVLKKENKKQHNLKKHKSKKNKQNLKKRRNMAHKKIPIHIRIRKANEKRKT